VQGDSSASVRNLRPRSSRSIYGRSPLDNGDAERSDARAQREEHEKNWIGLVGSLDRRSRDGNLARVSAYRVWAEIDLDALTHNLAVIRARAGAGVRVMLVVKADAYGHGAIAVGNHAVRCGIAALGVGTSAEALELRQSGLRVPILVLGTIIDEEAADALRHDVHIALHSSDRRAMIQDLAKRLGLRAKVHLNVDTGMGRLGVLPGRAIELLREIRSSSHLELCGTMTHVSAPDGALSASTAEQGRLFESVLREAREQKLLRGWIHMANSASMFTGMRPRYDTVRPGISAYGILPSDLPGAGELRPVMSLKSQVVFLKDIPRGAPVGYASTWRAEQPTRIATLPVGYDDGVPWRVANRAEVLVRGTRAPVIGRISMDYTTIDVGHIRGVKVGDTATLIGTDGGQSISVEEVACHADTIAYEITCSVGKRVKRTYVGGAEIELPNQLAPTFAPRDQVPGSARAPAQTRAPPWDRSLGRLDTDPFGARRIARAGMDANRMERSEPPSAFPLAPDANTPPDARTPSEP
jgi:alanine racemase